MSSSKESKTESKTEGFSTVIRIYGVPTSEVSDKQLTVIRASEKAPYFEIQYCGFKAGPSEVRQPTNRVWCLMKKDVIEKGKMEDFVAADNPVFYYDINGSAQIYENRYESVYLDNELSVQNKIFAESVTETPPRPAVDLPQITGMTQEALEQLVAGNIEARTAAAAPVGGGPEGGGLGAWGGRKPNTGCPSWYQSYRTTAGPTGGRADPSGADCES